MATLAEMKTRMGGAAEYVQTELWPLVDQFEQEHRVDYSGVKGALLQSAPLVVGGWLAGVLVPNGPNASQLAKAMAFGGSALLLLGVLLAAPAVIKFLKAAGKRAAALRSLKAVIKAIAITQLDSSFVFSDSAYVPSDLSANCGLFPSSYDRATAEDRCEGVVGETKFELLEIDTFKVEKTKNSKGQTQTRYIPIFQGLLLKADFNKNFQGHTTIETDESEERFGFLARGAQRMMSSMSQLKLIELENPQFEAHFKVRSTDPTQARYIITPDFMERVLALKSKLGANVQLAFMDSSVIVAIPRRGDFMEFSGGLDNLTTSIEWIQKDLVNTLELIEDLKLNDRIWNKQSEPVGA